jgi:hypothetical protein
MDLLSFTDVPGGAIIVSNGLALTETVAEALEALECKPIDGSQVGAYLVTPEVAKRPMIKAQIRTAALLAMRQAAERKKAEFKYKHTKKVLDIMKAIKHKTSSRIKIVTIGSKKYIGGETYNYREFMRQELGATWDPDTKTWIMDVTKPHQALLEREKDDQHVRANRLCCKEGRREYLCIAGPEWLLCKIHGNSTNGYTGT